MNLPEAMAQDKTFLPWNCEQPLLPPSPVPWLLMVVHLGTAHFKDKPIGATP
jgi:hypothetical protein